MSRKSLTRIQRQKKEERQKKNNIKSGRIGVLLLQIASFGESKHSDN